MRSYAIGDIHGRLSLLQEAHRWIDADRAAVGDPDAPIIHVGDLVDRGAHSREVVEMMMRGQIAGKPWIVLKGNHDRMFSLFVEGKRDHRLRADLEYLHPRIGGTTTLESYGIAESETRQTQELMDEAQRKVPAGHIDFLNSLPAYHQRGELLFAHAGISPGIALEDQTEDDMCWIRAPFLDYTQPHPWLVVHGHTAIDAPCHYGNRVNIDSGAAYGGPLTAIVIEGRDVFTLGPNGRTPLTFDGAH